MSKLFVDEIVHQSSQGSGTITLGASGEKINLGTGVSGGTLTNIPAFHVFESTDQTGISTNTWTVVQMDDILFDTDSGFANDTYTIPTGKAGKYYFYAATRVFSSAAVNYLKRSFVRLLRTRGSTDTSMIQGGLDIRSNPAYQNSIKISAILDCQAGDVYKIQGFGDVTGGNVGFSNNSTQTYFGAFRIIGA